MIDWCSVVLKKKRSGFSEIGRKTPAVPKPKKESKPKVVQSVRMHVALTRLQNGPAELSEAVTAVLEDLLPFGQRFACARW